MILILSGRSRLDLPLRPALACGGLIRFPGLAFKTFACQPCYGPALPYLLSPSLSPASCNSGSLPNITACKQAYPRHGSRQSASFQKLLLSRVLCQVLLQEISRSFSCFWHADCRWAEALAFYRGIALQPRAFPDQSGSSISNYN